MKQLLTGGIHPFEGKSLSNQNKIQTLPLPSRLILSLSQNAGESAIPIVKEGDYVFQHQMIARAQGFLSSSLHAPTSGTIEKIAVFHHAHPSHLEMPAIFLLPDGKNEKNPSLTVEKPENLEELILFLQQNGIVGLGGAGFPTHGKLKKNLEALLINAAECEPMVTSDDLLMQERAQEIVEGLILLNHYLTPQKIIIGIEDNKPQAESALKNALSNAGQNFEIQRIPTLYPSGNSKHLAFLLTGKKIPATRRLTSQNLQVFNVSTVYSIFCAFSGIPLTQRVITVTGEVERPGNYETFIGTPIIDVLNAAGMKASSVGVLHGGPMMGFPLLNLETPVLKTTGCLIAASREYFPAPEPEMPCIRCAACAAVCPNTLQPYALYWASRAKNLEAAEDLHLLECIECGSCAYVCPSHIPLVHYFRFAKSEIRENQAEKKLSELAKIRFERKEARLLREKEEKNQRLKELAKANFQKNATSTVEKA